MGNCCGGGDSGERERLVGGVKYRTVSGGTPSSLRAPVPPSHTTSSSSDLTVSAQSLSQPSPPRMRMESHPEAVPGDQQQGQQGQQSQPPPTPNSSSRDLSEMILQKAQHDLINVAAQPGQGSGLVNSREAEKRAAEYRSITSTAGIDVPVARTLVGIPGTSVQASIPTSTSLPKSLPPGDSRDGHMIDDFAGQMSDTLGSIAVTDVGKVVSTLTE